MRRAAWFVPGPLDARTGGTIYDVRMAAGLRRLGWDVALHELDAAFPDAGVAAIESAAALLEHLPAGTIAVVDSLAVAPLADAIERAASRTAVVALMHLPLAADPARPDRSRFAARERRALAAAARVVVTGRAGAALLAPYALPPDRLAVVEPGTDAAPRAQGRGGLPVHLLAVAAVRAGKGYDVLLDALDQVDPGTWRLTCVGSLTRDPDEAARVRRAVAARGWDGLVRFTGELDGRRLAACYGEADLFVLASACETYGMALAEALAHGLPVVATRTGAARELLGEAAGLLVDPGDRTALGAAIQRLVANPALRARLADGAWVAGRQLPSWDAAARRLAAVLERP